MEHKSGIKWIKMALLKPNEATGTHYKECYKGSTEILECFVNYMDSL